MNWLDFVIIAIVVVAAVMGMKTGLIGTAFGAVGAFVGWLVAAQVGDQVGGLFDKSVTNDTTITVITYALIMIAGLVAAGIIWRIARPFLSVATLGLAGMVDKLGGVVLGLAVGVAVSGALIVVLARFAYDFEAPEEGVAGRVADQIPNVQKTRGTVDDALTGSAIVDAFVDITDALPADALGFIPSDFETSLDILERNIEAEDSS